VGAAAAPGASNGMLIGGSNAATTFASMSITGQLDAGNLLVDGTTALTGAVTMPAGLAANITGNLSGSVGSVTNMAALLASHVLLSTTIESDNRGTTSCQMATGTGDSDDYIGNIVVLVGDEAGGHYVARTITDYNVTNNVITWRPAIAHDPVDGGNIYIVPGPTNLPSAAPGAAGGLMIAGSNAATTFATLTVSGATSLQALGMTTLTTSGAVSLASADVVGALTAGSVSIDGTADVIGALTCASFGVDGAVTVGTTVGVAGATTLASLSVTGQLDAGTVLVDGTTTLTGAVSLGAALGVVGATTLASLVVSGTTALTGAVTMPAGLTANITGDITGTLSTVTTCTTNSDMVGTNGAALASAYTATRASYLDELAAANLPTDIAAIPTTAEIKTAMEAANGDLDVLVTALVNKMVITEANGATEQFDDTDTTLGSIAAAFATDGTYTTRKRLVQ